MQSISLRNRFLHAEFLPQAGGGMTRFDWLGGAERVPLFRTLVVAPGAAAPTPSQMACFPMLPWANRIDPAGFDFAGRHIVPPPNRAGEPCPIHGDGWQYPWLVDGQSDSVVNMVLDRKSGAPFSYSARLRWELSGATLHCSAGITNLGPLAMPFGFGLHPFFPRGEGTQLKAHATSMWASGADKLPRHEIPLPPAFDFTRGSGLPGEALDNMFCGWDGRAQITWPERGLSLSIEADMKYHIVYAPPGADFFCFEPLDHAINANLLPGGALANGLTVLQPGQTLRQVVSFKVGTA
jgi:aldose 1-epimerase